MQYIIGNWKMNPPTLIEAKELFEAELRGIFDLFPEMQGGGGEAEKRLEISICPPFPYLEVLSRLASDFSLPVRLGAQDLFYETSGAYTGEISPKMLVDLGVEYVLIGHSERRRFFGEDDKLVNKKLKAALESGLRPILFVGDEEGVDYHGKLESKEAERKREMKRIQEQIESELEGLADNWIGNVIFVYEPVWAISSVSGGDSAEPEYCGTVSREMREMLDIKLSDIKSKESIPVLYGGSVDSGNVTDFITQDGLDGVVPGSASLSSQEFVSVVDKLVKH